MRRLLRGHAAWLLAIALGNLGWYLLLRLVWTQALPELQFIVLALSVLALLLPLLYSLWRERRIVRLLPLQLERRQPGLDALLPAHERPRIEGLLDALHAAQQQLERQTEAARAQARSQAAHSHELKGELATLRLLMAAEGERLPADLRLRLGAALDRLEAGIERQLYLLRTDEAHPDALLRFVRLDAVVDTALATRAALIEASGLAIAREPMPRAC